MMKSGVIWVNLACALSLFVACESKTKPPERVTKEVHFNQTLLREAVPFLESKFAVHIEISSELEHAQDLWLDYQTRGEGESLDDILNGMAAAFGRDHGLKLVVERLTTDEGKDAYRLALDGDGR